MKLKKVFVVLLAIMLLTTALSGCGDKTSQTPNESNVTSEPTEEETVVEQEIKEIIVTYLTLGTTPKDLELVQDAVNEITEKEIGVRVKFYPISAFDTVTNYGVLIAGGEQIDLMMLILTPMQGFVSNGSLMPLDALIETYGSDLVPFDEQYGIFGKLNDEIYTIMPAGAAGGQGTYLMKKDVFASAGLEEKEGLYTYEDLTQIFAAVKEANPDMYPYGATGPNSKANYSQFQFFHMVDRVGGYESGVLMDTESTQLVNMFETQEYYDFLKNVRMWFEAGYVLPDAATNVTPYDSLIKAGTIAGYPMANAPTIVGTSEASWGGAVSLITTEKYRTSNFITGGWAVPITSKEPEAAIKFMNYLYNHDELTNLIQWGIEGTHYQVVDEENGIITFAEGIDFQTSPYYNSLGLWGNQINVHAWNPLSSSTLIKAFADECALNPTKAVGFSYYNEDLTTTVIAVNEVLNSYLPVLETGSANDLDAVYNEFISALKDAGIDELIADKQAKFDEWLSSQQ